MITDIQSPDESYSLVNHFNGKITNNMRWLLKKFLWAGGARSKLILMLSSFITGYLVHFWISLLNDPNEIYTEEQPRHITKYSDVLLVILIFSSVNNFQKRDTLRDTWLSDSLENDEIKHYFAISEKNAKEYQKSLLSVEQQKHGDLLIFPTLEDSFFALTPKLVASFGSLTNKPVLGHHSRSDARKPLRSFKFVLKCDDDSYVRIDKIVEELKNRFSGVQGENLYWGFFDGRARVKKAGKYKEDQWNICDYYIPYALGGGYVLARPLVEFITMNAGYLKMYRNEDVSVGAWLSSYSGLNRVHDPRFDTEYISRGCHQSYLITHKHSETAIKNFHNNLKNNNQLCLKEFKTRMSYKYNWNVEPSKCCPRDNPNIP